MYSISDYLKRSYVFVRNQAFPLHKQLSTLMLYATDLCNSRCKHCLIWDKRPIIHLPKEKIIEIMHSRCVKKSTVIGLEGGEFLLHPQAFEILQWFHQHHKNFDLLSNCLMPQKTIDAVKKYPPKRLFVSLDGTQETYHYMRGKDGYDKVINVIENVRDQCPVSVMFTLSPYNSYDDLYHVAEVCERYEIDLRVGIYNNISYFDTKEKAHETPVNSKASDEGMINHDRFKKLSAKLEPFKENMDFLVLYNEWKRKDLKLPCYSIFDSMVVLPNGDVPICQNLDLKLGNVYSKSLDEIINCRSTHQTQTHHCYNCNGCWINFHRKYDIVLFKNFERLFGKAISKKVLGDYQWSNEPSKRNYSRLIKQYTQ